MTKQDKELLLKDLCARLPYGVFAWYHSTNGMIKGYEEAEFTIIVDSVDVNRQLINYRPYYKDECTISSVTVSGSRMFYDRKDMIFIKPYLRPMSSMTEEEINEYNEYLFYGSSIGLLSNTATAYELINWLLKNHFDFMGMIPKGLALEAPEGMYKIA